MKKVVGVKIGCFVDLNTRIQPIRVSNAIKGMLVNYLQRYSEIEYIAFLMKLMIGNASVAI